jgi:hypothetical protein
VSACREELLISILFGDAFVSVNCPSINSVGKALIIVEISLFDDAVFKGNSTPELTVWLSEAPGNNPSTGIGNNDVISEMLIMVANSL